jgi:serralysin
MSLATGINSIDALVYSSWNKSANQPVSLTFSFLQRAAPDFSEDDGRDFEPMTAAQQAAVREALASWSSVANVTFTEVDGGGKLQFGTNDQRADGSSAYAYLPSPGRDHVYMFLSNASNANYNFTPGSYGPSVLLHETGHLLGLKHPGNYDSTGNPLPGASLPKEQDGGDYTQMSYTPPSSTGRTGIYGVTPALYDIQAVQYLYGANMSYRAGNDTYSFSSQSAVQCIWDAGGVNTFDFSACSTATVINLNAGAFSDSSKALHNISIAYGVTIQNAIAGSGGSTIYGNSADNQITGGAGRDTVVFTKSYASYVVLKSGSGLSVTGEGTDLLQGIEVLQFADRTILASDVALAPPTLGSSANDTFFAATASPSIDGGSGLDTLVFIGAHSGYEIRRVADGYAITGNGSSNVVSNLERLVFSDGGVALDTNGAAGQLYRLYEAAFVRTPDAGGMGYWLGVQTQGASLQAITHDFINSAEFIARYGANQSDEAFVTTLYRNVLHRDPDSGGLSFHVDSLHAGHTREEVLLTFSESPENVALVGLTMPVGLFYT